MMLMIIVMDIDGQTRISNNLKFFLHLGKIIGGIIAVDYKLLREGGGRSLGKWGYFGTLLGGMGSRIGSGCR